MFAAVVEQAGQAPRYREFADPVAAAGYQVVRMRAAAVHRVVRSLAAGTHYAAGAFPLIPGVDGVAETADGRRVHVLGPAAPYGTLGQYAPVPGAAMTPVPDGLSDAQAAAIVNPAMSSLIPLRGVAAFEPGATVVVIGATGAAGRVAVRLAERLGAGRVLAVGRRVAGRVPEGPAVLPVELDGSDEQVVDRLRAAAPDGIDVVIDYLWGHPGLLTLTAVAGRTRGCTYVQVGALAGEELPLPSSVLRSTPVRIVGSGLGSVDLADITRAIPEILELAAAGAIDVEATVAPLADVERVWSEPGRLVLTC